MANNSILTIEQTIARLRQLVQLEVQHSWHDITLINIVNLSSHLARVKLSECPCATVNEKGYIVFPPGKQIKWLAKQIVIPSTLQGFPLAGLSLRLVLTWWAEDAQIFINGELVQQGDLFDSSARVLVTENAQPGQEYLVTIRLVSPNHDIGALMRSHLIYEQLDNSQIDPGLVADELTVLLKYISQFEPEHLSILATELDKFNWDNLNEPMFVEDLEKLRSSLLPLAKNIKQRNFNLLGHAHLDMAWLWTTDETYEIAERTFQSVLSLQRDFPALTFGHTSPALYQWIEKNRPKLFSSIQDAVKANKWEILGGMWIEPETNLVCGESLIRQLLYGQRYYQELFGKIAEVAWLPDSFGFTWQLPQIFKQCGIEYFVTGKLHWNDHTKFPHGCFWWESPDGTRLLTLMSPPNITGVMDTNPLTMSDYAVEWETQTDLQDIFWLPGVGDHGGGPTKDMLEVAAKWNNSPFFPEIKFSTANNYLDRINCTQRRRGAEESKEDFPTWRDELYLELHRGSYTIHAEQKRYNRRCERLLYEAELWLTFATLLCRDKFDVQSLFSNVRIIIEKEGLSQADPQQLIDLAWKKVLFNQFHDILPGTSISEVFTEANQGWESAITIGENLLQNALNTIAHNIKLPPTPQSDAIPVVVFNSLNWMRSQEVTLEDEKLERQNLSFGIYNEQGERTLLSCKRQGSKLTFLARNVPGVGYRLFWLCPEIDAEEEIIVDRYMNYELSNQYLRVVVNPQTGDLDSIFDSINDREILSAPGNELQAFEDRGQYWDAWNIDPEYEQKRLPSTELKSIEWIEAGLLRGIRVVKQLNHSKFIQDYILESDSPVLKIVNQVDWQETHVMVKAAFPLNVNNDYATYEIPCGTIQRSTKPQTEQEKAKWEVSALNWADLTDSSGKYGVSLLNDCKYGYDARPNQLRLTLLRAATWPDPQSDRGVHHFTYAIYPHQHSWKEAQTVQKGYEFNTPLQALLLDGDRDNLASGRLLPQSELLNLSADNSVLTAFKLSNSGELIMRCYETQGEVAEIGLKSNLALELISYLNCLEQEQANVKPLYRVDPYEIITSKLQRFS